MKENKIRTKFEGRVKELVDVEASNLQNSFKDCFLNPVTNCAKKNGQNESGQYMVAK